MKRLPSATVLYAVGLVVPARPVLVAATVSGWIGLDTVVAGLCVEALLLEVVAEGCV